MLSAHQVTLPRWVPPLVPRGGPTGYAACIAGQRVPPQGRAASRLVFRGKGRAPAAGLPDAVLLQISLPDLQAQAWTGPVWAQHTTGLGFQHTIEGEALDADVVMEELQVA